MILTRPPGPVIQITRGRGTLCRQTNPAHRKLMGEGSVSSKELWENCHVALTRTVSQLLGRGSQSWQEAGHL